ncbi:MAG: ATP-dependent DNA helicase RecG [Rikenellaceae bacterium]
MNQILQTKIEFLKGVGSVRAKALARELSIDTFEDLLYYYPFRYVDRSRLYKVAELVGADGTLVQFRGTVVSVGYVGEGGKRRFRAVVKDETASAELLWFKGVKWFEKQVSVGRDYQVFGRVSLYRNEISMVHPEVEPLEKVLSQSNEGAMQGVYSTTERLSNVVGAKAFHTLMTNLWPRVKDEIRESMPESMRRRYGLITLREALYNIHFPQSQELLQAAQFRLKFEELLGIQLNIQSRRTQRVAKANGLIFNRVGNAFNDFYKHKLTFPLTGAQKRVIKEIRQDCVTGYQMNRLLQGDVGSGKTVVALSSMLLAVDNGFQAAIMAPTEILARQHFASIQRMVEGIGVRVAVLTGSSKARERRTILAELASGEIDILVGTHALIEEKVQFARLGFVVIDEQHRFGVEQRARLWSKSAQPPHVLVMTATPIPRTLAMTLYGDLDVSVIDELPPGRKPIVTRHGTDAMRVRMIGFMRDQIAKGRQVYVVYPLINESESMDYQNLNDGFEALSRLFPAPKYQMAICHGQMRPEDKDTQMARFKRHEADILVATSVIEVGVDVPNASVIVIESAERFGLSQLHQLRGRVGRGEAQSYCMLMSSEKLSTDSRKRMEAMCETNDGFRLSELDLKLRGAGDVTGTQQSGEPVALRIANPTRDSQVLTIAMEAARAVLSSDPNLEREENRELQRLKKQYSNGREVDFSMIS